MLFIDIIIGAIIDNIFTNSITDMSISNRSRDLLTQTCLPPSRPYSNVQELSAQTGDSHAQGM